MVPAIDPGCTVYFFLTLSPVKIRQPIVLAIHSLQLNSMLTSFPILFVVCYDVYHIPAV